MHLGHKRGRSQERKGGRVWVEREGGRTERGEKGEKGVAGRTPLRDSN